MRSVRFQTMILALVLCLVTLLPAVALAEQQGELEIKLYPNNHFYMYLADGDQEILYFSTGSLGATSLVKLRIGSNSYLMNYVTNDPVYGECLKYSGNGIEAVFDIASVGNPVTGNSGVEADLAEFSLYITNMGSTNVTVGGLMFFDTMVGGNDGAPLYIPGVGKRTNALTYTGSEVPTTIYSYENDDPASPELVAAFLTSYNGNIVPDRITLGNYGNTYQSPYDFTAADDEIFDSAMLAQWNDRTLAAGASTEFSMFMGRGVVTAIKDTALSLSASGNAQTAPDHTFQVMQIVRNISASAVSNVQASISLPEGWALASGTTTETRETLAVGQDWVITWDLIAPDGATSAAFPLSAQVGEDTATLVNLTYNAINIDPNGEIVPGPQAMPRFNPMSGMVTAGSPITITSTRADHIYYTTDGTDPATEVGGSTLEYTGPITVNENVTIKAVAVRAGRPTSSIGSASYEIIPGPQATPSFSPASGMVASGSSIIITSLGADHIYYTTDGTNPATTAGGSTLEYTGPITVNEAMTINAIATNAGTPGTDSAIGSASYEIMPTAQATPAFSPASGMVASGTTVTITSAGADHIYYTTDGTNPATAAGGSTLEYTGPIAVSAGITIKAVATKAGSPNSAIGSASYSILEIEPEDGDVSSDGIGTAVQPPPDADGSGRVVIELVAEPVSDSGSRTNIAVAEQSLSSAGQQIAASYDVSLWETIYDALNAVTRQGNVPNSRITGDITVRLPLPAGYTDATGLTVVYIDDLGVVTPLPTTVVTINGVQYLEFTTNHFSVYAIVEAVSNATTSSGPDYNYRELTDEGTGLTVSGYISPSAKLDVNAIPKDVTGALGEAMREHEQNLSDTLYLAAKLNLTRNYSGKLTVTIPVGAQYNGQTVTLLHEVSGRVETLYAVVANGNAEFRVNKLGAFALFTPVQPINSIGIPKTGNTNVIYPVWSLIGIAALAGTAFCIRRKQINSK